MNPTAKEVASDLRKLADHFEALGDVPMEKPRLDLTRMITDKEAFLRAVAVMPHPLTKNYGANGDKYSLVHVTHNLEALEVDASAFRYVVCKMVRPAQEAEYECEPLLSQAEEESLV